MISNGFKFDIINVYVRCVGGVKLRKGAAYLLTERTQSGSQVGRVLSLLSSARCPETGCLFGR